MAFGSRWPSRTDSSSLAGLNRMWWCFASQWNHRLMAVIRTFWLAAESGAPFAFRCWWRWRWYRSRIVRVTSLGRERLRSSHQAMKPRSCFPQVRAVSSE
jgi:hypothetical protein